MKQSLNTVLHNNIFLMKHCFKAEPRFFVFNIFDGIRHELVVFLEFTIAFKFVLECVEFGRPFKEAAIFLAVLTLVAIAGTIASGHYWHKARVKAIPSVTLEFKKILYNKAQEIDLACYDNPEFYNDYILAVAEAEKQVERTFELNRNLAMGFTSFICSAGFFLVEDPLSVIFVAIAFFATYYASKALNKLNFKIRIAKNPLERKLGYTNRVFYLNDYAKEIRLNPEASTELLKDFNAVNDSILAIDKKHAPMRLGLEFIKNYLCNGFIMDVLYIIYLVYNAAVLRRISYSSVAVMHGTSSRMKNRMRFIAEAWPYAQETSMYVEKIRNFLSIETKIVSTKNHVAPISPCTLELRNVSFAYRKNDYILKNINMKIDPSSKIAIVGYNGAGKTTLIKLIMRLYDPCEGEILLDGLNIKEYRVDDYRRKIGAIFQDFKIFAATVKENVLLDHADLASDELVGSALEKSGFAKQLSALPNGLATSLTTEFAEDGVNLSGGEAQKLAIARAFYKDAGLIILDEPSSALDPIAEYHLNSSMINVSVNKSVIFISHRLSTTRIADMIYMLENGEIIESGSHGELLESGGKYAAMWQVQAGQYR
jgi:ATP-binding cassette subfamily B protein